MLRPEIVEQDLATIPIMIGSVTDATRGTQPDLWQRMQAFVLDGIRADRAGPLASPAPSDADMARILRSTSYLS